MPIYEYEPVNHECLMCNGHFEVVQAISEPAFTTCPHCGRDCKRVVSSVMINLKNHKTDYEKAGKKGFTTYRKVSPGNFEKIDGEGAEGIVYKGPPKEASPKKIDLDKC